MKKALIVITVLFFGTMLFLTFFAETIHNSLLPHVTVSHAESRLLPFEYTDENGNTVNGSQTKTVVLEELLENGVFVIFTAEKNGTPRTFVRFTEVPRGMVSEDGYVEVIAGINFWDQFVIESNKALYDGCEVIVEWET